VGKDLRENGLDILLEGLATLRRALRRPVVADKGEIIQERLHRQGWEIVGFAAHSLLKRSDVKRNK